MDDQKPNPHVESALVKLSDTYAMPISNFGRAVLEKLFDAGVEAGRRRDVIDFAREGQPLKGRVNDAANKAVRKAADHLWAEAKVATPVFHVEGIVLPDTPPGVVVLQHSVNHGVIVQGPVGCGRARAAEQIAAMCGFRIHDGEWLSDLPPPAGVIALQPPKNIHGEFDCPFNGQAAV